MLDKITQNFVNKTIIWQTSIILMVSVFLGYFFAIKTAISFILGGILSIIPGWLFAKTFFKNKDRQTSKKILHSFFYGEAIKWLVIIILFILIFQWKGLQAIPFFLGIIVTAFISWLILAKLS